MASIFGQIAARMEELRDRARAVERQLRFMALADDMIAAVDAHPGEGGNAVIARFPEVSRAVARRALRAAEFRGFVRAVPGRGRAECWFPVASDERGGPEARPPNKEELP